MYIYILYTYYNNKTKQNLVQELPPPTTNKHIHIDPPLGGMARMTEPDCAVMCNIINTHTHTHPPSVAPDERLS